MAVPALDNYTLDVDPRAISVHPVSEADDNNSAPALNTAPILQKYNQAIFKLFIPAFVMVLLVMIVGFVGNMVTVYIYMKKMRRTTSRIFILALAFCDLINCAITMPIEIAIIIDFFTFDYPIVCAVGRTLTYVLNGTSALLLCGIAVDRFRKICRPLKPVFTPKKTKLICIICLALASAVYIPGFEIYGTLTIQLNAIGNLTVIGKTCLVRDKYTKTDVNAKITQIIFSVWCLGTIGILITLVVFYLIIGRAVYRRMKIEERRHDSVSVPKRKAAKRRSVMADFSSETSCSFNDHLETNKHVLTAVSDPVKNTISQTLKNRFSLFKPQTVSTLQKQRLSRRIRAGRTTVMLFAVTIAYFISFLPFAVIVILRLVNPRYYELASAEGKMVWSFFLRSYVLNCAVNPILYGFLNNDFRKRMVEILEKCCCCFKITMVVRDPKQSVRHEME